MTTSYWQDGGENYARSRPTYPEELAKALSELAPETTHALDVGCGTGQLTLLLSDHFTQVVGCDVSFDQIQNTQRRPNMHFCEGGAEALPVPHKSMDLVTAAQAAHWFDLDAFYKEVFRVLVSDGVLALITYGVLEVEGKASKRVNDFYWNEIHKFWPKGREHVENGYRDFSFPFEPLRVPKLEIKREWSLDHFCNYLKTWSAYKRSVDAGEGDLVENLKTDLRDILGEEPIKVSWPISVRAGRLSE